MGGGGGRFTRSLGREVMCNRSASYSIAISFIRIIQLSLRVLRGGRGKGQDAFLLLPRMHSCAVTAVPVVFSLRARQNVYSSIYNVYQVPIFILNIKFTGRAGPVVFFFIIISRGCTGQRIACCCER